MRFIEISEIHSFPNSQVSCQLPIPGRREVLGEVEEDEPEGDELQEVGEDGDGREGLELLDGSRLPCLYEFAIY